MFFIPLNHKWQIKTFQFGLKHKFGRFENLSGPQIYQSVLYNSNFSQNLAANVSCQPKYLIISYLNFTLGGLNYGATTFHFIERFLIDTIAHSEVSLAWKGYIMFLVATTTLEIVGKKYDLGCFFKQNSYLKERSTSIDWVSHQCFLS